MMDIVVAVVAVILALAAAGTIFRIAKGPSLLDRVIGIDVLLAILVAALAVDMAVRRHTDNLALLVILSFIGFIGSVAVARFVRDKRTHEH